MKAIILGPLVLCIAGLVFAATPTSKRVVPTGAVNPNLDPDIDNIYQNFQQRGFKVYLSTPNLSELREGEMVIVSSTTKSIMFRINDTLYKATAN